MARKTVPRALPPLARLFPRFRGFGPADHQLASLQQMLRQAIRRVRRNQPHAFYSMREVSEFFGVPLSNVALAYKKLAGEGLLTQVRGSMTLVASRKMRPRIAVRAVVGVPIWVDGFVIMQDLPAFHPTLEDELWRYNVLTHFIFYKHMEQADPSFTERLLAHKWDYLIWFTPPSNAVQTMETVRDNGVHLVVVGDKTRRFPNQQYVLDWDDALSKGVDAWKRDGISSVVISRPPLRSCLNIYFAFHDLAILQRALTGKQLPHRFHDFDIDDFRGYVSDLIRGPEVGVIFVNHFWIATLLSYAPVEMLELFQKRRVMLTRVPPNLPADPPRNVLVDIVALDWRNVVRRVAKDVATQKRGEIRKPVTFAAEWTPRASLNQLTQGG